MLLKYLDFILESEKVESSYYYSKKISSFLKDIVVSKKSGWEVAQFVLESEGSDKVKDDITFIDMTDSHDKVSFIQLNRVKRMYDLQKKEIEDEGKILKTTFEEWIEKVALSEESMPWKKQRTEIFIGRFVNRLSEKSKIPLESSKIENFVNTYKSRFDSVKMGEQNFEEVKGKDIKKWYHKDNYDRISGELGNSCMRYEQCQDYFEIYIKNPEVCKLLILKNDEGDTIVGRALVWNLMNEKTFMDRVYTIYNSDKNLFTDYANRRGWILEDDIGWSEMKKLKVQLKEWEFEKYPYLDTFVVLNIYTGVLYSDEDMWPGSNVWKLDDTHGGYMSDNMVWSEYHSDYILEEDAVLTISGDWVHRNSSVYLEYKDGYATQDEETVNCSYNGRNYYLDDTYRSEVMADYVWIDEALEITINANSDTDWIHEDMEELTFKIDLEGDEVKTLLIFTIFNPIDGKYYFKDQMIDNSRIINRIIKSQELIPWEEVVKQILKSDFNVDDIKLPNGKSKFDSLVSFKSSERFDLFKSSSLNKTEISNLIKYLLIISPDKSERRPNGEPLIYNYSEVFNRKLKDESNSHPVMSSLLPKRFIKLLDSNWYWREYAGKAAIQLSDYFVSDVLKDPRAVSTWYSIKMTN
jgi:hypothetical protein